MSQEAIAKVIWDFLKQRGLTDAATAGVLGNINQESQFSVAATDGIAHGICQWQNSRFTELQQYAKSQGKDWTDLSIQMNFMWSELTGSRSWGFSSYGGVSTWMESNDVVSATKIFEIAFEGASNPKMEKRISYAKIWYERFKGTSTGTSSKYNSTYQYYDAVMDSENDTTSNAAKTEKTYEPYIGYNEQGFVEIKPESAKAFYGQSIRVADKRKVAPVAYFDNIPYGHRIYVSDYALKLGDSVFLLPPEFISIASESQSQNIVTLRQENTHKIKNGYQRRTIIIDLIFHGKDQINGYKVEGPEGLYYVDGLRQLLAQFKCTPFLPVTNELINDTYGIFTVALQSIVFQTVPGYPDLMSANLTLQEASVAQYTESHDILFSNQIDWDLFRFYYQRLLTETKEYQKLNSLSLNNEDNHFKLSILNENVFGLISEEEDKNFYNIAMDNVKIIENSDTNYVNYIDSSVDNFKISSFQCAYSNMLTTIQMADYHSPMIQYMGGMDTIFSITFETTDVELVSRIEGCQIKNNELIRKNRKYTGLGFVKMECELIDFCGSKFVLIDNVTTNTVPGFPGLISVQMQCVSFDVNKSQIESLNGFKPFKGDAVKERHCIGQDFDGFYTKIKQDIFAEGTMRKMELYPDLKLPSYDEVNEVIKKIITFRNSHKNIEGEPLGNLKYDVYPYSPQKSSMAFSTGDVVKPEIDEYGYVKNTYDLMSTCNYKGYVDPDFYVFYPYTLEEIEKAEKEITNEGSFEAAMPKANPVQTTYKNRKYSSTGDGTHSNVELGIETTTNVNVQKLIELLSTKLGCEYVWGSVGPNTFDCSGFITWGLRTLGIMKSNDRFDTSSLPSRKDIVKEIPWDKKQPGDILHYRNDKDTAGHVAIYIGSGKIIHSGGSEKGNSCVNIRKASYMNFQKVFRILKLESGEMVSETKASSFKITVKIPKLSIGDKGKNVKALQRLLKIVNKVEVEEDGVFGEETEKQVIKLQEDNNLSVTGVWDEKEKEISEKIINSMNSGVEYSVKNNSKAGKITKEELESIARVVAAEAKGGSYVEQLAIAQVIYDRYTDKNGKWGNLHDILNNTDQFKKPYTGNLSITTCLTATEAVFCGGDRSFIDYKMLYFLSKDAAATSFQARDNGKNTVRLGNRGNYTFWGRKEKGSTLKFITDEEDTSVNYIEKETTVTNGVETITKIESKKFGMPIMMATQLCLYDEILNTKADAMKEIYNTDKDILMSSFVDMCEFSGRGRMVRAFPTFLFALVDETGDWYDGYKFWSNYYMLKSVIDIQVSQYNDMPVQTATVTVSNAYNNLDKAPTGLKYYSMLSDPAYSDFSKWMYKNLGWFPGSPKITDKMIDLKEIIYNEMKVRPGVRMHLRMGYGSDPLGLPVIMNGTVSELSVGDTVTFICNSDGVEMINSVISTDKSSDNQGLLGLGFFADLDQESSNIIGDLLTQRESGFWNYVNNEWYEGNVYGMEHFGLYFNKTALEKAGEALLTGSSVAIATAAGAGVGTALIPIPVVGTVVGGAIGFLVGLFTADGLSDTNMVQYDLCKNLYRGNYKGDLFIYDNFWGFADGEENMVFNLYNKTPWDAIQMAVQNTPEYIGMPMYHQFDSRVFYGLPWWMAKYRYNLIGGAIFEEAKAHSQVHFIDSMCDIIDNQITVSNKNLFTNAIVMYSLGGSIKASPTMYSDKTITSSKEKTKIFDSSVKQDLLGPDQLYEWLGADIAEEAAKRVGASQLIYSWEKQYQGDLIVLGNPAIKPYDYIYLNDTYVDMMGVCTARVVTHSLSCNTGFITTINPGCISSYTQNNSQLNVHLANVCTIGGYFSYYSSIKKEIMKTAEDMKTYYSNFKKLEILEDRVGNKIRVVQLKLLYNSFTRLASSIGKTKDAIYAAKNLSKVTKSIKFADKAKDMFVVGKNVFAGARAAGAGMAGTGVFTVPGVILFAASILVEKLVDWVIESIQYNNCIKVFPLMYESKPFMAIDSGEKILAYQNETPTNDTLSDKIAE